MENISHTLTYETMYIYVILHTLGHWIVHVYQQFVTNQTNQEISMVRDRFRFDKKNHFIHSSLSLLTVLFIRSTGWVCFVDRINGFVLELHIGINHLIIMLMHHVIGRC